MEVEDYADLPIQVRMYGSAETCNGCRFWSEMIARSIGRAPIEAMCLASHGPNAGQYVTGRGTCDAWRSGHYGAIDDPDGGPEICAAYLEEEAA